MINSHYTPWPTPVAIPQDAQMIGALNMTFGELKTLLGSVMQDGVPKITEEIGLKKSEMECKKYGTFMGQGLSRSSQEWTFWVLFGFAFILLLLASKSLQRSERTYMHGKHHPEERAEMKSKQRRERIYSVIFTTIAAVLVFACVILEAFAALALTYCSGHKRIMFYWGMWTLIQVGALIAIIGVTVHQWACLGEHSTPPWNIALGTPILVITGAFHITAGWLKKLLQKRDDEENVSSARSMFNPDSKGRPCLIARKPDGGVIMEFPSGWQDRIEEPGEKILGFNEYGGQIIDYPPVPSADTDRFLTMEDHLSAGRISDTTLATTLANPSLSTSTKTRSRSMGTSPRDQVLSQK